MVLFACGYVFSNVMLAVTVMTGYADGEQELFVPLLDIDLRHGHKQHEHRVNKETGGLIAESLDGQEDQAGTLDQDKQQTKGGRRTRIAILVPFRNRTEQLNIFLPEIQAFLSAQDIDFRIVVAEQAGDAKFNRGSLLNIAFVEAFRNLHSDHYDCVVIHDVDLLPTMANNSYDCNRNMDVGAIQLSSAIDKYNWSLLQMSAGGVNMIRSGIVLKANGFSNRFFGWGGEDNDFDERMKATGARMERLSASTGRYKSIQAAHNRSPGEAEDRYTLLEYTNHLRQHEGMNSLRYRLLHRTEAESHLFISVELWQSEDGELLRDLILANTKDTPPTTATTRAKVKRPRTRSHKSSRKVTAKQR